MLSERGETVQFYLSVTTFVYKDFLRIHENSRSILFLLNLATASMQPPSSLHTPVVSIGLPVYNGESYLREALESLLGQTFQDFELIISDNASTDRTREIVLEYRRTDPRIRFFRQESNIGPSRNFLFVLKEAKGKWFMWASHDDVWASNWLEVLTNNIRPADAGIRGQLLLERDGVTVAKKKLPDFQQNAVIRCFLGNENNYRSHYVYSLFNRSKLLTLNPGVYSADYYPDAIFVYAILQHGALRCLPETYIRYRLHDNNLGSEYSARWKGWRKILYRIHPLRYYVNHLRHTESLRLRIAIASLIPLKHIYAQLSFWARGFREIVTGQKVI